MQPPIHNLCLATHSNKRAQIIGSRAKSSQAQKARGRMRTESTKKELASHIRRLKYSSCFPRVALPTPKSEEPPMNPIKHVLITGANRGIGREVAGQLAAKGFH